MMTSQWAGYPEGSIWQGMLKGIIAMTSFRTERDSMGDVQVPAEAYYGAQTQRAVDNFLSPDGPCRPP